MTNAKPSIFAIIPARGGSKGIPGKNVRAFAGKPLIVHSIDHAKRSSLVDRVIVTTDDAAIAAVSREAGAEVIDRPAHLANDTASSESALVHALTVLREAEGTVPDMVVFLQATSPIRAADDIDNAVRQLQVANADSLLSVCLSHDFLWQMGPAGATPANYDPRRRPRRQEMAPQYRENGSMYVFRTAGFLAGGSRLFGAIELFIMPARASLQIDTPEDFAMLEALARENAPAERKRRSLLGDAQLVVFDFDGVMSDNRVLVMQDGSEGALCNRSDGLGTGMLHAAGVPMLILSKEKNPVVGARAKKLNIECHQGIDDKLTLLRRLAAERSIAMERIVYVGNDVNDVACMRAVGCPIAVADAYPAAKAAAKIMTTKAGGHGAVREVCEWVLEARDAARG